ncbi:MAG: dynamin family protein [Paracoccaceae bacterium]
MTPPPGPDRAAGARPRLVLMGEFSSGKSTLANILLGGPFLPMQVTATRLPPVYVSYGAPSALAVGQGGETRAIDPFDLGAPWWGGVSALHVTLQAELLQLCDLVDLPGISDPDLPEGAWDGILGGADIVLWCTHATQAWRQSEAAMWERLRGATSGRDVLVVTQIDKLQAPRDRARVLARVAAETAGRFAAVHPVALLQALGAGGDEALWRASGVQGLIEGLIETLLAQEPAPPAPVAAAPAPGPARAPVRPVRVQRPVAASGAAVPADREGRA